MTPTIRYERSDHIATLTLSRPERRNAVSWQLIKDLADALARAKDDDDTRVLVITGEGKDFCVGADLAADPETRALRGRSVADDVARLTEVTETLEALFTFPKPTIAAVNGACAGAGLSLALAADFRIAAKRSVFNTAFVTAGLSGDLGHAWLLTQTIGSASARALMLAPRKIDGTEAHRLGLVTETVADLAARTAELAAQLAAQAPLAMAHVKANLQDAQQLPLSGYVKNEVVRMVECAHSTDSREAAKAFLEKRQPQFSGA